LIDCDVMRSVTLALKAYNILNFVFTNSSLKN
jgi:hypothetical protein